MFASVFVVKLVVNSFTAFFRVIVPIISLFPSMAILCSIPPIYVQPLINPQKSSHDIDILIAPFAPEILSSPSNQRYRLGKHPRARPTSAAMCYGTQEYFVHCRHPGNFIVLEHCRSLSGCRVRLEEDVIHIDGFCPACQHAAYTGQPRGRQERRCSAGTPWNSFDEMNAHYHRRALEALAEVNLALERCQQSGGAGYDAGDLRRAQIELREVERWWRRDTSYYQAESVRRFDEATFEAMGGKHQ